MKKLEEMSDAELDALLAQTEPKKKSLEEMSDDELDALLAKTAPRKESIPSMAKDYAIEGASLLSKAFDYPIAPIREFVGTSAEALAGKKGLGEVFENTIRPLTQGPSEARPWSKILESLGIPEQSGIAVPVGVEGVMTEEEKAGAPPFYPSAVAGSFLEQATPAAAAKTISKIPFPSLIDRTGQAAKAIGISGKQFQKAEALSPQAAGNIENLTGYAKESGIMMPFSSRAGIVERSAKKMEEAGQKLHEIIKGAEGQIDNWMATADPKLVDKYLESGFNIPKMGPRMMRELSQDLEGGAIHDSALRELDKWLTKYDALGMGHPDIAQMQKWKQNVGKSIKNWEKFGANQPAKEAAYKKIYEYLDKGIDGEVNFAENFLKGAELEAYRAAKREYSQSKMINDTASAALAKERTGTTPSASNMLEAGINMIRGPRYQSTMANVPMVNLPQTPVMTQLGAFTRSSNIEQYNEMVNQALMMGVPPFVIENEVQKLPLKPTEKAQLRQKAGKAAK